MDCNGGKEGRMMKVVVCIVGSKEKLLREGGTDSEKGTIIFLLLFHWKMFLFINLNNNFLILSLPQSFHALRLFSLLHRKI